MKKRRWQEGLLRLSGRVVVCSSSKTELKQQGQTVCGKSLLDTCLCTTSSSTKQLKHSELCNKTPVWWQRPHLSPQNM